eukprot:TRINITY_DN75208_c0_g1_i1.p1 TRINITY_DN75208_c0_g1~~TRINITY_DN75208_c0_g1_i1.p1  ORF type:complete len:930 (-),score=205.63 TRINITY_DN75208_c0_g1_i1:128-2917(-)
MPKSMRDSLEINGEDEAEACHEDQTVPLKLADAAAHSNGHCSSGHLHPAAASPADTFAAVDVLLRQRHEELVTRLGERMDLVEENLKKMFSPWEKKTKSWDFEAADTQTPSALRGSGGSSGRHQHDREQLHARMDPAFLVEQPSEFLFGPTPTAKLAKSKSTGNLVSKMSDKKQVLRDKVEARLKKLNTQDFGATNTKTRFEDDDGESAMSAFESDTFELHEPSGVTEGRMAQTPTSGSAGLAARFLRAASSTALGNTVFGSKSKGMRTKSQGETQQDEAEDFDKNKSKLAGMYSTGISRSMSTFSVDEAAKVQNVRSRGVHARPGRVAFMASKVRGIGGMSREHLHYEGQSCREYVEELVEHSWFSSGVACLIVLNAVVIGAQTEWSAQNDGGQSDEFIWISHAFTFLFALEQVLRIFVYGRQYFCEDDSAWNIMDFTIVVFGVLEFMIDYVMPALEDQSEESDENLMQKMSLVRLARIMRVFRVVRVLRVLRIFRQLRVLINAIVNTMRSCLCTLWLLCVIIYMFSTTLTQAVNDARASMVHDEVQRALLDEEGLKKFYGSLFRSTYTLFQTMSGGVSWIECAQPLSDVHSAYVFLFLVFVFFVNFAVLNVVTGIFCQSAIESAQQDNEEVLEVQLSLKRLYIEKLQDLFEEIDQEDDGYITLQEFEEKLQDKRLTAYLSTLDLDVDQAWTLFKLIDREERGAVSIDEFVDGCLRLRGAARGIDLNKMMYENRWIRHKLSRFMKYVEAEFYAQRMLIMHSGGDASRPDIPTDWAEAFEGPKGRRAIMEDDNAACNDGDNDSRRGDRLTLRSPRSSEIAAAALVSCEPLLLEPLGPRAVPRLPGLRGSIKTSSGSMSSLAEGLPTVPEDLEDLEVLNGKQDVCVMSNGTDRTSITSMDAPLPDCGSGVEERLTGLNMLVIGKPVTDRR